MDDKSTKEKIIYQSIVLFGTYGYQEVSMRQIAAAVGIKAGSIYNHFVSKEEILDHIIEGFAQISYKYRPDIDTIKLFARTQSPREVLAAYSYTYRSEDVQMMLYLYRIVFSEQYRNNRVQNFFLNDLLCKQIEEVEALLLLMMQLDKIPHRNAHLLAEMWVHVMCAAAMRAGHQVEDPHTDLAEFGELCEFLIDFICGNENSLHIPMP